jgi:hypothetical protein
MNPNSIRARLAFSFKGENYALDSLIDLDSELNNAEPPNFHLLLAKTVGIDPYSYLYEVLESHPITFSEPSGLAALSCRAGEFDWPQFEHHRRESDRTQEGVEIQIVRKIAEMMLGVRDLDREVSLKAALLAAYQAGKEMQGL